MKGNLSLSHGLEKPRYITKSTLRAACTTFLYSAGLSCILVFNISNGCVNVVDRNPAATPDTI